MLKKLQTPETINALITRGLAIEADEALDAGMLGFVARCMMLASLPHSSAAGSQFQRRNGAFSLTLMAPTDIGLPYGTIPRLLLAWLTTEAVRTKSRELVLGDSLSSFMRQLDLVPTGGRWGSIGRLRNQTERLFACNVTAIYRDEKRTAIRNHTPIDKASLWWDPKAPGQGSLWQSCVTLGEQFYLEVIDRPVPVDMRALRALKKSPMALDLYSWLTYRMSYLTTPTVVSWGALQGQFGAGYPQTALGLRHFRQNYLAALRKVLTIYGGAKAVPTDAGMRLEPGRPHVRKLSGG